MKNKRFSELDKDVKKAIFNGLTFFGKIKGENVYVAKRKDFSLETEIVLADFEDKKVISLFLGILSFENSVSDYFLNKGITLNAVLNYIGINKFDKQVASLDEINPDENVLDYLSKLKQAENNLSLNDLIVSLMNKFSSNSDLISNFYFSEISKDNYAFVKAKEDVKELGTINYIELLFDTNNNINYEIINN